MKYFATFLLFLIPFIAAYAQVSQQESVVAELSWAQACFRIINITATATVYVTDPDMNKFSGSTDTIKVFVYSDSYPEGITLTLYETDFDSGVFERTFGLSDQRTAPSVLYTQEGDTITAKYVDTTLPPHTLSDQLELTETAFIGCSSPPLERVPASSARIVDSIGNTIDRPAVGEQVHIISDIANGQNREQKFSWLAQIMDDRNKVVSLGWINGVLNPESAFSPSMSWIPQKTGQYSATMFVWESLDNPSALSPPISIDIEVGLEDLRAQRYGSSEMFLFITPQENFKNHISTEKLSKLHFYKIEKIDTAKLPRLDLLLDMLHSFPAEYRDEIAVRINDSVLAEYVEFFHQNCLQRTFANDVICQDVDMAFEFEEKWYLLNVAGRPNVVLEESTPSWDEDFFNRYKPYEFYDSRENRSGVSLDRIERISPKKQAELGVEPWCNPTFVLITKFDGTSACVKPETKQILIERRWTGVVLPSIGSTTGTDRQDIPVTYDGPTDIPSANNQFAIRLYSKISQENTDNVFFSPASIFTAFAIAYEGADGNTAKEMKDVFGFEPDDSARHEGFANMQQRLNFDGQNNTLSIANALWLAKNFEPYDDYVSSVENYYSGKVESVDFASKEKSLDIINQWVHDNTGGKIEKIFETLDPQTKLAITNAIYFKGMWEEPFEKDRTAMAPFHVRDGLTVNVPMMELKTTYLNQAKTPTARILELPYEGSKISMLILLPNEINGIRALEDSLSAENIGAWQEDYTKIKTKTYIPKFKLETDYDLIPPLVDLGIRDAFGNADFSGISELDLFIYKAAHKALVEVNEEGTEAAAATGMAMLESGPVEFRADHPFVFVIQDNETGQILFMGRVTDPTK